MTDKDYPSPSDRRENAETDDGFLVNNDRAKVSAIGSKLDRAVLQSSWIQRLKPFASSEEEEEVATSPDRGHVWTHFTKDFRSCSRRSNNFASHVRSSSWPLDVVYSQEKLAEPLCNNQQLNPPSYANIPFVPSDDHGRSTDLSWKTGNLLLGQQNSHTTKRHSSTEAIVPCFQNRETISVEKPRDSYEASDALKCKSDIDTFTHFRSEVKDDDRRPLGGRGFQRPPLHSRNIKKGLTILKDDTLLSWPRSSQYDGAHKPLQDETANTSCRKSFHCPTMDDDKESPLVVVSHNKKYNTSIMQTQGSHGIKLQSQKATSKADCCRGRSKLKTAVNFGFLLLPQKSSRPHSVNSAKGLEDNSCLKSNASRLQNISRMCTVGSSQAAGAGKLSTLQECESMNVIDGTMTNRIQSRGVCNDFVAVHEKAGTTPLYKETSRTSLPEANVDDNWSSRIDVLAKSTPVMPEEANSSTASLPQEYILEEYRKQLKPPDRIIRGKQPIDILTPNEMKFVKSRYQDLCSTDLYREILPPTFKDNGKLSGQGTSRNMPYNSGDIRTEHKSQIADATDSQRSGSTQKVWIQRWSSSPNIHATSGNISSVFPETKRSTCSNLFISSKPNTCSSVRSRHSKKKNTIECNNGITNPVTEAKHVEIASTHFGSIRRTSGTTFCANKSNVNTFENFMSRSAEALAIVGTTANKPATIQRRDSCCVWPSPTAVLTTDAEHHDINEDTLHLNMDRL